MCKVNPPKSNKAIYCGNCKRRVLHLHKAVGEMVSRAVRNKELPSVWSQKCVDCGSPASDYDHRDYGKPLQVDAVCSPCNIKRGPALKFGWRGRDARIAELKKAKQ